MSSIQKIKLFYDKTSEAYTQTFLNELEHKPFDRHILQRFSAENKSKGKMADLGCGPGQTTHYLHNLGITDIIGIDLSDNMIEQAKMHNPQIAFETGNILQLNKPDNHFTSILAFYAIVHFDNIQLTEFFYEVYRVLQPKGQLLFSFHIGHEITSVDELLGVKASADFYFHQPDDICEMLTNAGFTLIDVMIRYPYKDKEYPSKRAYLLVEK